MINAQNESIYFLEGNAQLLTDYFKYACEKPVVSVALFGSEILSDIQATSEFNQKLKDIGAKDRWHGIAVVQELN
jgi:hypothetical protein